MKNLLSLLFAFALLGCGDGTPPKTNPDNPNDPTYKPSTLIKTLIHYNWCFDYKKSKRSFMNRYDFSEERHMVGGTNAVVRMVVSERYNVVDGKVRGINKRVDGIWDIVGNRLEFKSFDGLTQKGQIQVETDLEGNVTGLDLLRNKASEPERLNVCN